MNNLQTFAEKTEEIYNHLADGLSKEIFENRVLYSLTNDYKFIRNIINLSPAVKDAENKLKTLTESGRDIIIYGAGVRGKRVIEVYSNIEITAFCDANEEKQKNGFLGYKVIQPSELKEKYFNACIVISPVVYEDIYEDLLEAGFNESQLLIFSLCISSQYFDSEIPLAQDFLEEEVFIDAGCYNCDTDMQFINWCNNKYEKIIAFEPDPKKFTICEDRSKNIRDMTVYPYGLWNKKAELSFDNSSPAGGCITGAYKDGNVIIKTVKLDDILNGEKATFIKMDIEGAELNALKGSEQTILKYRPKLAISVYHKPEDIWEIPAYILSLHSDYKLYLRHYSFWEHETVIYAV